MEAQDKDIASISVSEQVLGVLTARVVGCWDKRPAEGATGSKSTCHRLAAVSMVHRHLALSCLVPRTLTFPFPWDESHSPSVSTVRRRKKSFTRDKNRELKGQLTGQLFCFRLLAPVHLHPFISMVQGWERSLKGPVRFFSPNGRTKY